MQSSSTKMNCKDLGTVKRINNNLLVGSHHFHQVMVLLERIFLAILSAEMPSEKKAHSHVKLISKWLCGLTCIDLCSSQKTFQLAAPVWL